MIAMEYMVLILFVIIKLLWHINLLAPFDGFRYNIPKYTFLPNKTPVDIESNC
jgi:hypothetical protein